MAAHDIVLTDSQEFALGVLASRRGVDASAILDEQVAFYVKSMLTREFQDLTTGVDNKEGLTDAQKAELAALRVAAAAQAEQQYLAGIQS